MLLAIDIGNTHTVIGVYAGDSLRAMWRIATNRKAAADELRIVFSTLFSLEGLDLSQVRASAVASVVPQLTKAWMQAIKDATGARSLVCNAETAEGLFDADYPNPREIGADRVADAVARQGAFTGRRWWWSTSERPRTSRSSIATAASAAALSRRACRLRPTRCSLTALSCRTSRWWHRRRSSAPTRWRPSNRVSCWERPTGWTGWCAASSTSWAIQAKVIATGGLAPVVERYSSTIDEVNTELTLEGLRLIADRAYR